MSPVSALVPVFVNWWKKADRVNRLIAVFFVLGVALVALSVIPKPGPDAAWVRDVLMSVGSSIALFAPFYLLTRTLDSHIEDVREQTALSVEGIRAEAAQNATRLTDEMTALQQRVDERLAEFSSRVTTRLTEDAEADAAAFARLRLAAPTREAVTDAFTRASELGLVVPHRPPRVGVSDATDAYVSLYYNPEAEAEAWEEPSLEFRLENIEGHTQESIPWALEQQAEDVVVQLGRALRKHTGDTFDAAAYFAGLADLLDAANTHPHRRPAVQLCPPQWLVTTEWLIPYDETNRSSYTLLHRRLRDEGTLATHVQSKGWVDQDSLDAAVYVSQMLFPANPWEPDEPPF
jgi:hypothetical protein